MRLRMGLSLQCTSSERLSCDPMAHLRKRVRHL